ncbi:MAG: N-acetyltransferase [archaeon]|nr:N-acetyltransferase [archaeon]
MPNNDLPYTVQSHVILNKKPVYGPNSLFAGKEKDLPDTEIGDGSIICSLSVIYAGTTLGKKVFVGDGASIRENVQIGDNCVIGRNVTIECNVKIGNNTKIQTSAHITGDCFIGDDCFIGPEVCMMNDRLMGMKDIPMVGPTIEDGVLIGGNATIYPGVKIGKKAIISAGSVINRNVPSNEVWMGNPAKCVMLRGWFEKRKEKSEKK